VHYTLEYPDPVGRQVYAFRLTDADAFRREIAPARTFGFVKEIAVLEQMGLANGGRLNNFVLVGDEGVVNAPLRFPDEFVRHKILDIMGDFYLLGRPIRGRIVARKTGHSDNVALLRRLRETIAAPTLAAAV
jgi:UDP-3-O-acyl-N-acetylglucosamine deacetylase